MPTYQYACYNCGNQFEKRQSFHDAPLSICPTCNGKVERVISPVGVIFKGSGFYINDSKSGKSKSNGTGSKSSASSTALPAAKTTSETPSSSSSSSTSTSTSESSASTPTSD